MVREQFCKLRFRDMWDKPTSTKMHITAFYVIIAHNLIIICLKILLKTYIVYTFKMCDLISLGGIVCHQVLEEVVCECVESCQPRSRRVPRRPDGRG